MLRLGGWKSLVGIYGTIATLEIALACFLSSGMLIGDEEAASHWAHDRLLGAWMCPASWPFWMHDARSPCLLGNVTLRALPPPIQTNDLRPCGAIGHQLAAAVEGAATGASAGGRRPERRSTS